MKRIHRIAILLLFTGLTSMAQEAEKMNKYSLGGYISGMPSIMWMKYTDFFTGETIDSSAWQVLLHNRLNFSFYPTENITIGLQIRNQLIGGEFVRAAQFENGFTKENYFLPLTFYQTLGDQYLLSISIDRLFLKYTYNNLEITAGRQRINWGQTFVWNPNDIFNSYNFFDFDYPERPGADALRIQYYTSYSSSIDLAAKVDSAGKITGGGLFRFTKWNTEFQLLAGYFSHSNKLVISDTLRAMEWEDQDIVGGLGFSGAIQNLSIRSELSYFYSLREDENVDNQFLASITFDYTFSNQTALLFEFFYNSNVQLTGTSFLSFYAGTQNVKTLTFTKYNFFGQVTYPVIPILNATLASMYFTDDNLAGYFLGPNMDLSLGDNLTLSAYFQFFSYKIKSSFTHNDKWSNSNFAFLRLKWNF
jgi:hypothetical protein